MKFNHLEFLLEESSSEAALTILLPRLLPSEVTFRLHTFSGKLNLLGNLPSRLKGYRAWIPEDWGIVVLLDEDREDCLALKADMETKAEDAGFATKSRPDKDGNFTVVNRICVEELEAWFFGDMTAVRAAYPRVAAHVENKAAYRDPDSIKGGTWEALERVLQEGGYHQGGLAKTKAAKDISAHMLPANNTSYCFQLFRQTMNAITPST